MQVCAFNFSVSIFSPVRLAGEGKMKELLGLEKIPARLHPLLRQPVVPSEAVAPFEKHKKRARDFLLKNGTRHELLNWVTDPTKKSLVTEKMTEIQNDFYNEKAQFLDQYPEICAAHLKQVAQECENEGFKRCAELVEIIRKAQPTVEYLDSQIQFKFLKPKLVELDEDEEAEIQEGIYWQALNDLAYRAKSAVKATLPTTQIRAAKEIIEKLESLIYLDNRYQRVARELAGAVKDVPVKKNEGYSPGERLLLTGVFSVMLDAKDLDARIKSGAGLFPRFDEQVQSMAEEEGEKGTSGAEDAESNSEEAAPVQAEIAIEPQRPQQPDEPAEPEQDLASEPDDAGLTDQGEDEGNGNDDVSAMSPAQEVVYAW